MILNLNGNQHIKDKKQINHYKALKTKQPT